MVPVQGQVFTEEPTERISVIPPWRRRVRTATAALGWVAFAAGSAGVVLHYFTWPTMLLALAASFASYFMVGAVIALVLFGLARQWRSAAIALVPVAAGLWAQLPMLWPDGSAPPGVDVAVMQSNLLFGHADVDTVVKAVRDNRIEVLTLEELTPEALARLRAAGLETELPYSYTAPASGGSGGGIFSRYPLQDGRKLDGFLMSNVQATMLHPDRGPVQVFQFHPMPPNLDFDAWSRELPRIREVLDQQTGQVIVGGDFNATYDHKPFRDILRGRYADAGELVGVGALPTWPEREYGGPHIGIDKVLVAGGHATEVRSLTIPDSDHRAVVAVLRL
ncbi:endonuclease/exonuclease/phosphatase family protein [Nocardia yamanashiensis]|uniref:endonuclease/exonuclease/phosphatase family protein n=1 Tax=Nocardia yamanashiensis TaxID=209247 RepID=UPI000AEA3617|nr:endonuclease/exonuclease/phosphatase family protein [Nocardia yamanashiensis]